MEQKILMWQSIVMTVVTAVTTIAIFAVQAIIRFQREINRFKDIRNNEGESAALKATRISRTDAQKRGLMK
jgi:cytochrome b subunit of formate dehydrogenase